MHDRARRLAASLALALLLLAPASAAVLPEALQQALDRQARNHVGAPGFQAVDAELLTDARWYDPRRFPAGRDAASRTTLSHPDAALHPLVRAILLLDSREAALPHPRYRVSYRRGAVDADHPDIHRDYVEVVRYNLGPARHADVLAQAGDAAAPAEVFGTGPSVAWRFVMGSVMGMQAEVFAASRRLLSMSEVERADCLGAPCAQLPSPEGPSGTWETFASDAASRPLPYADRHGELPGAARLIDDLLAAAGAGAAPEIPASPRDPRPQLLAVISLDVDGHEAFAQGLLLQDALADDSIGQLWTRRLDGGEHGFHEWARQAVRRR